MSCKRSPYTSASACVCTRRDLVWVVRCSYLNNLSSVGGFNIRRSHTALKTFDPTRKVTLLCSVSRPTVGAVFCLAICYSSVDKNLARWRPMETNGIRILPTSLHQLEWLILGSEVKGYGSHLEVMDIGEKKEPKGPFRPMRRQPEMER